MTTTFRIERDRLATWHQRESQRDIDVHPRSIALAGEDTRHSLFGSPMHWMRGWPPCMLPVSPQTEAGDGELLASALGDFIAAVPA